MGFLNRTSRLGLFTVLLLALSAIPSAWDNTPAPGTAIGPTYSWAGGTPDESLNPQPTPSTTKRVAAVRTETKRRDVIYEVRTTGAPLSVRDRLIAMWTLVRAMSLRN